MDEIRRAVLLPSVSDPLYVVMDSPRKREHSTLFVARSRPQAMAADPTSPSVSEHVSALRPVAYATPLLPSIRACIHSLTLVLGAFAAGSGDRPAPRTGHSVPAVRMAPSNASTRRRGR